MAVAQRERRRILFVGEAVTLAHVARPLALARSLDPSRYEMHFACADRYDSCFTGDVFRRWPITSIPPGRFLEALAAGKPLYDMKVLQQYMEEDLAVIAEVRPDLVVGDFRLSLAVSAPLSKVTYAALTNAQWSPYATARSFPLPEHPLTTLVGVRVANLIFNCVRPAVFALHAQPLNALRRKSGLPELGDLRQAYTHGDYTLYADTPDLVPTVNLPANHTYLGPVLWSPDVALPGWWDTLPSDRPWIYVTLGSSGQLDVLPRVISALAELPVYALVATADRLDMGITPRNIWAADYLPGLLAARHSMVVICNGGSATAYQALAAGVPVLGIASNMDQYLTMSAISQAGAGVLIRAGSVSGRGIQEAIQTMLAKPDYHIAAKRVAQEFARFDAPARFRAFLESLFDER